MIEVRRLRIPLQGHRALDGNPTHEARLVQERALALLRLDSQALRSFSVYRRSIDARGHQVFLEFTARLSLKDSRKERAIVRRVDNPRVSFIEPALPSWPAPPARRPKERPVIVGAGCAGLFCALGLAHAGLDPLLIEQGDDCARRTRAVKRFFEGGSLDPASNIQFGLGGAGTFSDGKLSTGTKDPSHRLILETLVAAGAPERILIDAQPHVGSDVLPLVVEQLVQEIESLGGEVRCRTKLVAIELAGTLPRRVAALSVEREGRTERLSTDHLILACGHSARDVYELLAHLAVPLEQKPFAVGVRIEHPQREVDRCRYGRWAGHPALGAAPYKTVANTAQGRRCFSFCMCPGGVVVAAASEPEGVVTNGASDAARNGANANAGLLVNVTPEDVSSSDPLAGIAYQRAIEKRAFNAAGGHYQAPAQLVGDFLQNVASDGAGAVTPSYPLGVSWGDVGSILPAHVSAALKDALPRLAKKLSFFGNPEAVLTAPETRSSSPIRIPRDETLQHPQVRGLYPVGEGGGWAGGLMSAAADGLRAARALVKALDK